MKKNICVLIVFILIGAAFAGCGTEKGEAEIEGEAAKEAGEAEEECRPGGCSGGLYQRGKIHPVKPADRRGYPGKQPPV